MDRRKKGGRLGCAGENGQVEKARLEHWGEKGDGRPQARACVPSVPSSFGFGVVEFIQSLCQSGFLACDFPSAFASPQPAKCTPKSRRQTAQIAPECAPRHLQNASGTCAYKRVWRSFLACPPGFHRSFPANCCTLDWSAPAPKRPKVGNCGSCCRVMYFACECGGGVASELGWIQSESDSASDCTVQVLMYLGGSGYGAWHRDSSLETQSR